MDNLNNNRAILISMAALFRNNLYQSYHTSNSIFYQNKHSQQFFLNWLLLEMD